MRSDAGIGMRPRNLYFNENKFMCDGYDYERDDENGRCYRLEESISLLPEMDGALVKRRISAKVYEERKAVCLKAIEKIEQLRQM